MQTYLHYQGWCAKRPILCVKLLIPLCKSAWHLNQIKQMSVHITEKITFTLESNPACDMIWREQGTQYYQLYIIERHNCRENGISLESLWLVILTFMCSVKELLTVEELHDKIFHPYIGIYIGGIIHDLYKLPNQPS